MGRERERRDVKEGSRGGRQREDEKTGQGCKVEGKFLYVYFADENYLKYLKTERKETVE